MTTCTTAVFKRFAKRFLPVALSILVVAAVVLISQRRQYVHMVQDHEINLVKGDFIAFSSWFESGVEDVCFMAGMVEDCLNGPGPFDHKYEYLARIFAFFGKENRNCVQVRLLSPLGAELVRVNVDHGNARRVAGEFLQDKSNRQYFRECSAMGRGVYVSSFDLNKEYGKVSIPYLPVVRFLKNIYSNTGDHLGMIVINLDGSQLLEFLRRSSKDSFGKICLVNDAGGWILGPDKNMDWRFAFGDEHGYMGLAFPVAWNRISEQDSGQFSHGNSLFTFTSLKKVKLLQTFRHNIKFEEGWDIISIVDEGMLVVPWSNITIALVVSLGFLSGFFFWRTTMAAVERDGVLSALENSERRFKDVADAAGEFIWETGPDGSFVFVTGRAEDILGYSSEELIGRSPFDFVDEDSSWEVRKEFLDAAHKGESFSGLVFRFVNREGRKLWLEFNGVPVFDGTGSVTGFRGATSDITAQQRAIQDLQDREDMLQSISDSVQDALVLMDENGLVHFWNPAAENIFGYTSEEMLGESLNCCIMEEDNEEIDCDGEEFHTVEDLFTGYGSFTVNVRRKGGFVFPAEVLLSPLRRDDQWWVVGTFRDVTERKEAEDKLRRLATTDPLTGLANRRFFMESAEDALSRSLRYERDLSLLMLDIDYFKNVNDMYGHDAGDDVLKGLSVTGMRVLRKIDIFGRIGGEEFSVLLPDTGLEGAEMVAERLRSEIEQTRMLTRSGELSITVSIGVATLNEKTRTLEHLLKAADVGLYAAKHAGRNRVMVQLSPRKSVDE